MKAIRVRAFGPPEVMRLEEVPDPSPGRGQVLVRIRAAGVNPVEAYIRSGAYARRPALPYTPGNDAAGIVEAVGDGVRGVSAGDRVYTSETVSGAYAELALCDETRVHPLPASASYAQGAAVGVPCATAWRALFQRRRGDRGGPDRPGRGSARLRNGGDRRWDRPGHARRGPHRFRPPFGGTHG